MAHHGRDGDAGQDGMAAPEQTDEQRRDGEAEGREQDKAALRSGVAPRMWVMVDTAEGDGAEGGGDTDGEESENCTHDVLDALDDAEESEQVLDEQLGILLDNYEYVCAQFEAYEARKVTERSQSSRISRIGRRQCGRDTSMTSSTRAAAAADRRGFDDTVSIAQSEGSAVGEVGGEPSAAVEC